MPKAYRILLIVVIILFAALILRDFFIKSIVSFTTAKVTGAKVTIGSFSLGTFNQSIQIKDFKMYNPKGFTKGLLVDMPNIVVNYNLSSLLKGRLYLPRVDVYLKEIGLQKNKEGRFNVDSLKVSEEKGPQEGKAQKAVKLLAMRIDLLNLKIGRVVFKDYSMGKEPVIKVYDINLNKSYKNITSAQQLAALILTEPMKEAGIKGLKIYGAGLLAGVGFMPVAIFSTLMAKDTAQENFNVSLKEAYRASLQVLKDTGKVNRQNDVTGIITAEVNGSSVTVKIREVSSQAVEIKVSARKHMFPSLNVAKGILYQISEKLKQGG